jgi:hypothetical protein
LASLNVGTGWDDSTNVGIGGDGSQGLMYSWHADGTMRWCHHDGWWNGASTWKANSGRTIGGGWDIREGVLRRPAVGQSLNWRGDASCDQ